MSTYLAALEANVVRREEDLRTCPRWRVRRRRRLAMDLYAARMLLRTQTLRESMGLR